MLEPVYFKATDLEFDVPWLLLIVTATVGWLRCCRAR
jgi:hypothetical protein